VIEIIAESAAMREARRLAERVAATKANVLITGESGTGKNALARFIHALYVQSQAARDGDAPYVEIDCAALPRELLEAELFGYERGAFTGAVAAKPGRIEAAHKGTLVLDEIAHLTADAQAKLLRVIERKEFERLGGQRTVRVDCRLIALTNVDLEEAVKRRAFREDLYFRLNVVRVSIAPLRQRREDILPLAAKFLSQAAAKHGVRRAVLTKEARRMLEDYDFPGNARELAHIIERAVIIAGGGRIGAEDLPETVRLAAQTKARRLRPLTLREVENEYIREILALTKGNKSEAARILGISRKSLYERMRSSEE
jgi:two-component system response regulator AtoC